MSESKTRSEDVPSIELYLDNMEDNIGNTCINFEWRCFINSGHIVRILLRDSYQILLQKETVNRLLQKSRNSINGLDVAFRLWYHHNQKLGKHTDLRKMKVIQLDNIMDESAEHSYLEIVAIDPISWCLNKGVSSGLAYQGNISSVIKQIVMKYADRISDLKVEVDETKDNKFGWWWEMRLDPKTLITSLIEWSSSITKNETPFVVQSEDNKFIVKEWHNLISPPKMNDKEFHIVSKTGFKREYSAEATIQILSDGILGTTSNRLYSGGISATTGLYIAKDNDLLNDKNKFTNDKLTDKKIIINLKSDQSFTKPDDAQESTFITPIPEHNNLDIGIPYQDYSIGRARNWFIKLIYNVLRVKITIEPGDSDFDTIRGCGITKVALRYIGTDDVPYFINGNWLLYGFVHTLDEEKSWKTELMLARTDYNAEGKRI